MKKTAFKTFVFSFVFSLFAFFCINRVFFCTPKRNINSIKISNKNITLFLKNEDFAPIRVASVPTPKIILSTVEDIPSRKISISDNIPPQTNSDQNVLLSEEIQDIIPIENISLAQHDHEQKNDIIKDDNIQNKEDIILASADIIPFDNNAVDTFKTINEEKKVVYAPEKEIIEPKSETKDIPLLLEKKKEALPSQEIEAEKKESKTIISKNEVNHQVNTLSAPVQDKKPEPTMLIPLENSSEKLLAKATIKKAEDAENTQVALTSKETPIRSMEMKSVSNENVKPQSSTKKWESMKDKRAKEDNEDPWIVAKGNNFPNNQFLADDKYKISKEEIDKIFDKKNQNTANAEEIQLASKTVKNLLIPIPEDILNDENLTPQLISSPKNKEIQEELEAKGLIKKEETPEEPEPQVKSEEKADIKEEQTSTSESGILDSITSLFGTNKEGNNNDTPAEDFDESDDEDSNSLFSVFNKKQNKLISKILPTEIRLSFQPNRAEISGQTLRWIKAFAQKTAEEPSTGLEIRIDGTSSPLLQRRRLNLLQNILLNEGAPPAKINTVFTAREPNSLVLRTVRIKNNPTNSPVKNNNRYMRW